MNDTATLQAGVTNMSDAKDAASTLGVEQARADQAAFIPGEGRGFFVGAALRF